MSGVPFFSVHLRLSSDSASLVSPPVYGPVCRGFQPDLPHYVARSGTLPPESVDGDISMGPSPASLSVKLPPVQLPGPLSSAPLSVADNVDDSESSDLCSDPPDTVPAPVSPSPQSQVPAKEYYAPASAQDNDEESSDLVHSTDEAQMDEAQFLCMLEREREARLLSREAVRQRRAQAALASQESMQRTRFVAAKKKISAEESQRRSAKRKLATERKAIQAAEAIVHKLLNGNAAKKEKERVKEKEKGAKRGAGPRLSGPTVSLSSSISGRQLMYRTGEEGHDETQEGSVLRDPVPLPRGVVLGGWVGAVHTRMRQHSHRGM
ncbi:hypothetical protein KIPB_008437 [Kipferlia bialata]|uniref:Uncharacterized protein n=1 Tax=Kipferlia bialata TaxID=797122 RepID=A0A9K3CV73_9EUKA|nr:hypothetical protein KIPB_005319 [Kipferlia bialata]GIQ86562.1 hypothetical protein KIPB_008437 [Kipferlia bialata]|eukprot:g5319.t1